MIFRGNDAMLEECRICGSSRYKRNVEDINDNDMREVRKDRRLPVKVACYFAIIPRLKLLFANKANAMLMWWRAVGCKKDGMLRHPVNGIQ